jgi:hypothetical protein
MIFLELYWKQIVCAGALIGAFLFGFLYEKGKFDAFKTELAIRTEAQKIQNDKIVTQQKQITSNVAKEYADAVKKLNAYYTAHPRIKWVRNSSAGAVSDVSNTASSTDAETESNLLSASGASPLDCAADVLQLLHLQQWVRDQENANR